MPTLPLLLPLPPAHDSEPLDAELILAALSCEGGPPWPCRPAPLCPVDQAVLALAGAGLLPGPPPWVPAAALAVDRDLARLLDCEHCGAPGPCGLAAFHDGDRFVYRALRVCHNCTHVQEL